MKKIFNNRSSILIIVFNTLTDFSSALMGVLNHYENNIKNNPFPTTMGMVVNDLKKQISSATSNLERWTILTKHPLFNDKYGILIDFEGRDPHNVIVAINTRTMLPPTDGEIMECLNSPTKVWEETNEKPQHNLNAFNPSLRIVQSMQKQRPNPQVWGADGLVHLLFDGCIGDC